MTKLNEELRLDLLRGELRGLAATTGTTNRTVEELAQDYISSSSDPRSQRFVRQFPALPRIEHHQRVPTVASDCFRCMKEGEQRRSRMQIRTIDTRSYSRW